MKKQLIMLFVSLFLITEHIYAHPNGKGAERQYYEAYEAIDNMLIGERVLSFKDAVFFVENAHYEGKLSYSIFNYKIQRLSTLALSTANKVLLPYKFQDSTNIKLNYGVSRVLMDSVLFSTKGQTFTIPPPNYNFEDFTGQKDWTNMFVTKLLIKGEGNCHSLPYLYKILTEEVGAKASLALAPHHIYIKTQSRDPKIGWYNTELTNKSHPSDAWIIASGYISLEAIQNSLYMEPLSNKQSIALCLIDLAQGYARKHKKPHGEFVQMCLEKVLRYYPHCVNALLMKVDHLYHTKGICKETNQVCQKLLDLGYDQMPKEMYLDWLSGTNHFERNNKQFTNQNNEKGNPFGFVNNSVPTLSQGRYAEFHEQEIKERIGQIVYNTKTKQITDYAEKGIIEPTIVSRFLSVDPLMRSYPSWTPYAFAMNRVIDGIDLEGLEWAYYKNIDENGVTKIKITVNINMQFANNTDEILGTKISEYQEAISSELNRVLVASSNGNVTGSASFTGGNSTKQAVPLMTIEGKKFALDGPDGINVSAGAMGYSSSANIYNKDNSIKSPQELAGDFVHELFHLLRLDHPTDYTQFEDTELIKLTKDGKGINEFLTTPNTSPIIKNNILIYDFYKIDGVEVGKYREENPGYLLTPNQMGYIIEEIDRQKTGVGTDLLDMYWYEGSTSASPLKTQEKSQSNDDKKD